MQKKLNCNSLLTVENIKKILDTERPLSTRNDTLIVQFATGCRIMKRERIVSKIHEYRWEIGWNLAQQFGAIEELILVGKIDTPTIAGVNFNKFPFIKFSHSPVSIMLSGCNSDRSWFVEAQQYCNWNEEGSLIWEMPSILVTTKQPTNGLGYILEDIYEGSNRCIEFNGKHLK